MWLRRMGCSCTSTSGHLSLLSRPPGYWIRHMDHEEAVSAALRLQHDAGLIMTNLQVCDIS